MRGHLHGDAGEQPGVPLGHASGGSHATVDLIDALNSLKGCGGSLNGQCAHTFRAGTQEAHNFCGQLVLGQNRFPGTVVVAGFPALPIGPLLPFSEDDGFRQSTFASWAAASCTKRRGETKISSQ